MALLRPGWEEDYHKKPPIHPVVCVGRILQEERLADGRYHLLLQGLCRARIRSEVASTKLYRIARVELCADEPVAVEREKTLRGELGESVKPFFAERSATLVQLQKLLQSPLPLGALSDIFAFVLPLDVEVKQRLLESLCVESRVHLLLANLDKKTPPAPPKEAPSRPFPPEFSSN
jgi:Lon protease-like protein